MSEKTKLSRQEIEQQLLELQQLIETEPAPATPEPEEEYMKPLYSDKEICELLARNVIMGHQQKNYQHVEFVEEKVSALEQDPTWSDPLIKRKVGHLRKMLTIVNDNPQSTGCMIAFLIGTGLPSLGYWLTDLF